MTDAHHHCEGCGAKIRYRMVKGTSIEGVSIREVHYDDQDKIIDWSDEPKTPPGGSKQDIIDWLVFMFKDFDEMLEATEKPVLDEAKLEAEVTE